VVYPYFEKAPMSGHTQYHAKYSIAKTRGHSEPPTPFAPMRFSLNSQFFLAFLFDGWFSCLAQLS
jgi:hypothetical protein